ncbi:MAG: hypothetical protein U5L11_02570 [Arhodomonas sp.]|nr:hypothetical protein [Arhodomonas sp.]
MRYWTTQELRTLRELYPVLGPRGIAEQLPGRSYSQLVSKASIEGIQYQGPRRWSEATKRYHATPELDAAITRVYQHPGGATLKDLAAEHGVPHWWLKRRAVRLGLSRPATKPAPWSEAELAIVRDHHHHTLKHLRSILAAAGYQRTETAIHIVRKRKLGLSPRAADRYSATAAANLLGVNRSTVLHWIKSGWIEAEPAGTARTEQQGGDMWDIHHQDLRRFIIANPHRVRLAKVEDQEWFIKLLAGTEPDGRQNRRKRAAPA